MRIIFKKKFKKSLAKQTSIIQKQFTKKSLLLITNSNHSSLRIHFLKGKLSGLQSFDVTSDIRVQFYIRENEYVFVNIGTHSELY